MEKNENDHYRGLHIVVIDVDTGRVETAKVFDTYESSEGIDAFIDGGVPEGHIVVAACKDECTTKLSMKAKEWFDKLGCREFWALGYRCGFSFIGIMGQQEPQERIAARWEETVQVTQVLQVNDKTFENGKKVERIIQGDTVFESIDSTSVTEEEWRAYADRRDYYEQ